ncbi:MAG TPA: hypothetical protein VFV03_00420, partial [Solirubrobacteraceae bacterium]|nr:hypothetical protein [Solirubrobacteraceae bacterium]
SAWGGGVDDGGVSAPHVPRAVRLAGGAASPPRARIAHERFGEIERATHEVANRTGPQPCLQEACAASEGGH